MAATTAATSIGLAAPAQAGPDGSPSPAARGVELPVGAIPWSQVSPGWSLATWSPVPGMHPGEQPAAGEPTYETATTTLYLVDPAGGRYAITTFPPPGDGPRPALVDWSGDGSRALFTLDGPGASASIIEVDLHTGAQTTTAVQADFTGGYARYSRPEGKAVLIANRGYPSQPGSLVRVDLAGNHQLTYQVPQNFGGFVSTPDGTQLVLGADSGLTMMGNNGIPGKALPVAGQKDCAPTRWWDTGTTVVARCNSSSSMSQLWLVPIDGATPTALTAPNNGQTGPDYGDLDAWRLPTGTFVQAAGACGVIFLAKLNANGTTTKVSVPDVHDDSVVVIGSHEGNLTLKARAGCGSGQTLLDYNPAAGTSTVLLGPTVNGGGVISVKTYPGQE